MNIIKRPVWILFWGNPCYWYVEAYVANAMQCAKGFMLERELYNVVYTDLMLLDCFRRGKLFSGGGTWAHTMYSRSKKKR